ncbi:unnamed protein product [Meganyctiphanes norvegica]|uniref:NADP-dependent oxidoreductase domain-containing protein n=1 Tax=Meganyctiphanes norvegica TaxID=48144 RepID=A0AAV2Q9B4_MEGNR
MAAQKNVKLSSGKMMPLLGLGCWQSPPEEVAIAVETALDAGYRHIDTAYNYLNEEAVGKGIHAWMNKAKGASKIINGAVRKEIFVVTKLPMIGMYAGGIEEYLRKSLKKLQLDYVDLYLVHSPIGFKGAAHDKDLMPKNKDGLVNIDYGTDQIAVWKEMEKMVDLGLTKSIGVSNFNEKQLRRLLAIGRIPPAVNQIEMHLEFQQLEMHKFCKENNIILTAYGPLGSPGRQYLNDSYKPQLLNNALVKMVADHHKVTTAQVLIRYWIQRNVVVIPKSTNKGRIQVNGDVLGFQLTEQEMEALLGLNKGPSCRSFRQYAMIPGVKEHADCPFFV